MDLKPTAATVAINGLKMIHGAKSGHPGGVLSCLNLIVYLFFREMNYNLETITTSECDRFILSKGHSAPALYAVAAEVGIIDKSLLKGFRKINEELQGHPHRVSTPWVQASTGSLGQGFSFAIGEALGLKLQSLKYRVYTMLGDGELQEGEIWEGAMFAGHYKLNNLCAIIDYNKMQSDDLNKNIMGLEPLGEKWRAFNWYVIEIDGHNYDEMEMAFDKAKKNQNQPTVIIANTIKGNGVSFMEGNPAWHGSVELSDDDLRQSMIELGANDSDIKEYFNE
jgi:transketolase